MTLFPLFVKLEGRKVLVVGGGPVGESKLDALLKAGAAVTVVAPKAPDASGGQAYFFVASELLVGFPSRGAPFLNDDFTK